MHTALFINVSIISHMENQVLGEFLNLTCNTSGYENLDELSITYQWTGTRGTEELLTIENNNQKFISIPLLNLSNAGRYTCHVIIKTSFFNSPITANSSYDLILNGKLRLKPKSIS